MKTKNITIKKLTLPIFMMFAMTSTAMSSQEAMPMESDQRIQMFTYDKEEVYNLHTFPKIISTIQFNDDESIQSILIGDSESWEVIRLKNGNIISIKPLIPGARSNMTVYTDKRVYSFDLDTASELPNEIEGVAEGQMFRAGFKYPGEETKVTEDNTSENTETDGETAESTDGEPTEDVAAATDQEPEAKPRKKKYDFDYLASNKSKIRPLAVYDDGTSTYFKLRKKSRKPSIFAIDKNGKEVVVNLRTKKDTLIADMTSDRWVMKLGREKLGIKKR